MNNNFNSKSSQTNSKPFLKISNLYKSYGKTKVFEKFNLEIKHNDRIALLGVNGSGKSTLIEIILGLRNKNSGRIEYSKNFKTFLRNLQVVFQIGKYPNNMRVSHLVSFYRDFYAQTYPPKMITRLVELLELKLLWKQKVNKLSFGQQKKLEALLMFMIDCDFYIIDELTAGVDINTRVKIFALFQNLLKKNPHKGMIWITHDSDEIEKLCNRIVILSKNNLNIVFDGSLKDVKIKFKSVKNMVLEHLRIEVKDEIKVSDIDIKF